MSPAAVYVHHPSKEALLFAISREGHLASLDAVSDAAASAGAPGERVRAIVRAFVLRQAEHHDTARIVNYELGALSPDISRLARNCARARSSSLCSMSKAARDNSPMISSRSLGRSPGSVAAWTPKMPVSEKPQ